MLVVVSEGPMIPPGAASAASGDLCIETESSKREGHRERVAHEPLFILLRLSVVPDATVPVAPADEAPEAPVRLQ